MAFESFKPTIWSKELNLTLEESLVSSHFVNRNYEGEARLGAKVKIIRPDDITIDDYDGTDMDVQIPTADDLEFEIDKYKYFNFAIDDVDKLETNTDLAKIYLANANRKMRLKVDRDTFAHLALAADSSNVLNYGTTITKDNILEIISSAMENLDENDVPLEGRVFGISPREKKFLADLNAIPRTAIQDQILTSGVVGDLFGFKIVVSNQLYTQVAGDVGPGEHYSRFLPYGAPISTTFGSSIDKIEAYRFEKRFSDGIKGLFSYGMKTTEPLALGVIKNKLGTRP